MVEEFPVKVNIKTEIDKADLDKAVNVLNRSLKDAQFDLAETRINKAALPRGKEYAEQRKALSEDIILYRREILAKQREIWAQKEILSEQRKQGTNISKVNDLYSKYRKSLTGVLIDLHFLRIIGQSSRVVNRSFEALSKTLGALLDVILIPMLPVFMILVTGIQQLAGIILKMPAPLRLIIGALASFGIALFATITILKTILGLTPWAKSPAKRASGGPLSYGQAAIVGERGPELMIPTSGGYHVVPNDKLRFLAEGTGIDPIGTIVGGAGGIGIAGYLSGWDPLAMAAGGAIGGMIGSDPRGFMEALGTGAGALLSNPTVQGIITSINMITTMISAIIAPIAPIAGILAGGALAVRGIMKDRAGGAVAAQATVETARHTNKNIGRVGAGIQGSVNASQRGITAWLGLILNRMNGCFKICGLSGRLPTGGGGIGSGIGAGLGLGVGAAAGVAASTAVPKDNANKKPWITRTMITSEGNEWGLYSDGHWEIITPGNPISELPVPAPDKKQNWDELWAGAKIFPSPEEAHRQELKANPVTMSGGFTAENAIGAVVGVGVSKIVGSILSKSSSFVDDFISTGGKAVSYGGSSNGIFGGLLKLPSFAEGGTMPNDGLAYLHKGEVVVPVGNTGNNTVNVYLTVTSNVDQKTISEITRQLKLELTKVRA